VTKPTSRSSIRRITRIRAPRLTALTEQKWASSALAAEIVLVPMIVGKGPRAGSAGLISLTAVFLTRRAVESNHRLTLRHVRMSQGAKSAAFQ
jgi:hypothetical protein